MFRALPSLAEPKGRLRYICTSSHIVAFQKYSDEPPILCCQIRNKSAVLGTCGQQMAKRFLCGYLVFFFFFKLLTALFPGDSESRQAVRRYNYFHLGNIEEVLYFEASEDSLVH